MYDRIYSILGELMECDSDDRAKDTIYEMEADVYTTDLTRWLHDHNENVYYLTEAMTEGCCDDGFALLQWAQCIYIREIGQALITGIEKYIESEE